MNDPLSRGDELANESAASEDRAEQELAQEHVQEHVQEYVQEHGQEHVHMLEQPAGLYGGAGHHPVFENEDLSEDELNKMIEALCDSKAGEFRLIGYEHVTGEEVWQCVSDKYKKGQYPLLHRIVNDILSLKVTQFMNWMTLSVYKSSPFQ